LNLFKPDFFSSKVSKPTPCNLKNLTPVQSLIDTHYKFIKIDNLEIFSLGGGIELNSSNLIVKDGNKKYLLKILDKIDSKDLISDQVSIVLFLQTHKVPVAKILEDNFGKYIIEKDDKYYYLMNYDSGVFYDGSGDLFHTTMLEIINLSNTLEKYDEKLFLKKGIDYSVDKIINSYEIASSQRKKWNLLFTDYEYLTKTWDEITKTIDKFSENKSVIEGHKISLCHIDLHPHNILTHNGKVSSILDYSSFENSSRASALAFAFYKLSRQSIVKKIGIDPIVIKNDIFKAAEMLVKKKYFISIEEITLHTKVELIRRLFLIMMLNIKSDNQSWNFALKMQINGLYEIDKILEK
tara:strand:- start:2221 stop:3276 length:1056 start_codon:yes stop_codon:yes gene_type:complete